MTRYSYIKSQEEKLGSFLSIVAKRKLLLTNILFLIILIPVVYLSLKYGKSVTAAWHDDTFAYRKQLNIGNSGSTITSARKIKIEVDTATLISANKMQSDCDDTRFVGTNGKSLRFFIDTDEGACNTSSTDYYVELTSVATGNTTIYLYYGNSSVSSTRANEFFAPSSSSALGNKLKGFWALDEASGVRYDSALSNSLTDNNTVTSTTGKVNTAAQFTASNAESLTRSDNAELSTGDIDFTISAWVYLDTNSDLRPIVAKDDGSGSREYLVSYDQAADLFAFEIFDGGASIAQVTASNFGAPSMSTWYFITAWHNSGDDTINIQINNGTANSTATGGIGPTDTGETFKIGMNRETVYHFDGRIDNVLLWKRTLTAGEKTALYNSGNGLDFGIVTFSPTSGPTALTEEATPGPVVYWKFDEGYGTTTQETTLNDNDGTISGSTWKNESDCVAGKCLSFDGSNDKVTKSYSSDTELAPGTGSFSVSGWFKHSSIQSGTDTLLARADGLNGVGYKIYMNSSGFMCFGIDDSAGSFPSESACSTTSFADSNWHHFNAVKSGTSSITLYLDGSQVAQDASLSTTGSLSGSSSGLYVGIDADGSSNPWTGTIDDIKIYPFARSAAQVKTDANFAGSSKGTSVVLGATNNERLTEGLVGYWNMDESSGTRSDRSGNGNTLTDNNTVTANPGKFGNAGQFTSANSESLSITNNASLAVGDEDFTVAGWVYLDNKAASQVFARKLGTGGWLFDYHSGVDSFQFVTYDSGGGVAGNAFGGISPSTATWYYIVGWQDSKNKVVGFTVNDGTPVTATYTGSMGTNTSDFIIGGNSAYWNGRIDEVRMYKRLLSPAERRQLYTSAPGPVGYWNMDERTGTTANDISGNGYTGTLTDGPTWTSGKIGAAIDFDGSDDRVTTASVFGLGTTNVTMSAWVFIDSATLSGGFVKIGSNGNGYSMGVGGGSHDDTGNDLILLYEGIRWIDTGVTIGTGWHHVAMVIDASGLPWAYIDGVSIGSFSGTGAVTPTTRTDIGGNNPAANPRFFNGKVDDVKIYNYPRTAGQVLQDMNGGHPLGGSPIGSQVAYWKLDEGQGASANDVSINTNTLTLSTATSAWTSAGKFGKAWDGNGSRYISRADDANFDVIATDDYAISLWYKSDSASNPGATEYIINKSAATTAGYAVYANTSGQICFGIDDDTTWNPDIASCSTVDYYDATWHQITAQRDVNGTDKTYLYIDGKLQDSDSDTTTATLANSLSLYIGDRDGTDNGDEFTGNIDEIKVYRGVLSQNEILIDFDRGSATVMGALSDNSTYEKQAANQEYCVPGDSTSCVAPVAEWKLDEKTGTSTYDTSGGANTGTLTGNPTWSVGKFGSGVNFDGNDMIAITSVTSTIATTSSISYWIKTNQAGTSANFWENPGVLGVESGGTDDIRWGWIDNTGKINFDVANDYPSNSAGSLSAITDNNWHYIAMTRNASTGAIAIYIDGILNDSATGTTGTATALTINTIGAINGAFNPNNDYIGHIDNIRIYDYVRTPAQITWEYNHGGPIAYFKLDECSGSTANDSSLNNNTGTISIGASGSQTSAGSCNSGTSTEAWNNGNSGKYNGSLKFDGTDDYVSAASSNSLKLTSRGTISAWINAAAIGQFRTIVDKGVNWSTSQDFYSLYLNSSNRATCTLGNTASSIATVTTQTNALSTSVWYHLVCTWDGTTMRIYVNGVQNNTASQGSIVPDTSTSSFYIGRAGVPGGYTDDFSGQIDDVRIYNYALTAAQVRTTMAEGSAVRFGPSSGQP